MSTTALYITGEDDRELYIVRLGLGARSAIIAEGARTEKRGLRIFFLAFLFINKLPSHPESSPTYRDHSSPLSAENTIFVK